MTIFNYAFWKDVLDRAIGASATSALSVLTMGAFSLIGDVPWYAVVSAAATGALYDVLRSLAASRVNEKGTAGFVDPPTTGRHGK